MGECNAPPFKIKTMCATRLDLYEKKPRGFEEYLSQYGWHFSKSMYEWAVSMMRSREGRKMSALSKEDVKAVLDRCGITLENDKGYDSAYVMMMGKSDYLGSSIVDEIHLARFVKDYVDDQDAYEGMPFTRFYADCVGSGTPIDWEDML